VKIETTLAGSYPKLPTEPGDVNLRVAKNRRDQGKGTDQDVLEAVRETTRRILKIQERAGVDIPWTAPPPGTTRRPTSRAASADSRSRG
jgi:methionine synthase II (cobalamin-independent)